jgi:AmmeMemoRadiSam system protein A
MSLLSSDDWLTLVEIARRSISCAVLERSIPDFPAFSPALSEPRGAFVSLYRAGVLRGCVGQIEQPGALGDVVARSAVSAALHDTRFPPVAADEVASLDIEISVLGPPERISPEAIVVGRDGLLVVHNSGRGLLLPQVATERHWSSWRFLEETCVKAGLARDAWRDPATRIYAFTAEVFPAHRPTATRES